MDTYKEFTFKQQIIFYLVATVIVVACAYYDFEHSSKRQEASVSAHSSSIEQGKLIKSNYEVAHSTFTEIRI